MLISSTENVSSQVYTPKTKTQHEETEMDHAFSHTDSIPYQKQEMRSGMQKGMRTNMATVYRVQIISHMRLHSCKTQQSREQPGYFSLLKMFISSFMQNQTKLHEIYFGGKRGYPWHRTVNSTELSRVT